ncbi:MAG UNVERIFIED_CONTAM: amidohydrolase family protein [Anaerolineae bacterium]|jgi:dihydroorotase-like cyclic amidohydrolase
MYNTLIQNGNVVTERGIEPLDIGIVGERIAALLTRGTAVDAQEVINASGMYVLPGAIDIHFHCRAPAYPQRGDFATETRAAAAGGVTTIFEMPISKPCCATGDVFRMRKALGQRDAYVNFALYGAPGLLDRAEIADMVQEGAIGFKIFMTAPPAGRDDEFEGLCLPDVPQLYQALQLVGETGRVCVVHAENNPLLEWHTAQLVAAGRNDIFAHGESRPPHVEALAIATLLVLNVSARTKLHIAHVSGKEPLEVIRAFQVAGASVTGETCPHYLFFNENDLARVGPTRRSIPPYVWSPIKRHCGAVFWTGRLWRSQPTTHPSPLRRKRKPAQNIWRTPPGAPGVEELVLGMMDAALMGKMTINHAVNLISTNGAKRFGIYPQKGTIAVNSDADLVIYDPTQTTTIHEDMLFSQAKACDKLYAGMSFQGRVVRTLVNGNTVFVNGEVVGARGGGKFVRPLEQTLQEVE